MSLTVSDIMKLPCLRDARVIAGAGGLTKAINSVSVLEYANPDPLQQSFFDENEFYGSEIGITAFASIPNDYDLQCLNIRRLAAVGEVGLILYYVGVLMPCVSPKLIELADELDFVLILMPENRLDLRYSEVITEVMEAVFRDQLTSPSLVSDVLAQMARLPEHQRTLDSVLRITRDRLRCSLVLCDGQKRVWAMATWPLSLELEAGSLPPCAPMKAQPLGDGRTLWRCPIAAEDGRVNELYLLKDGDRLSDELVAQTLDLVKLSLNLWNAHSDAVQISELVRAILQDEPMKMHRLAELFHIDVASMHSMWIISPAEGDGALEALRTELTPHCHTFIADKLLGCAVAFTDDIAGAMSGETIARSLSAACPDSLISHIHRLQTTAEVRRDFLLSRDHIEDAQRIWPQKRIFTRSELEFAAECRTAVDSGEESLERALRPLSPMDDEELRRTLAVHLLDADGSVTATSQLLYLHKNTVKYRLGRISALFGHDPRREPERFLLYRACAIWRLTH